MASKKRARCDSGSDDVKSKRVKVLPQQVPEWQVDEESWRETVSNMDAADMDLMVSKERKYVTTPFDEDRDFLHEFILDRFDKYDVDRGGDKEDFEYSLADLPVTEEEYGDDGWSTVFSICQRYFINKADKKTVKTLVSLAKSVAQFQCMDKETMVPFAMSGFVFSSRGKIVLFNER